MQSEQTVHNLPCSQRNGDGSSSFERLDIGNENIEATTEDAAMFLVEVDDTTKLIRERTKCPVPEVLAYDGTLTYALGAPFIIMKACVGVKANTVWFGRMYDGDNDMENADFPSAEYLIKHRVFLESLARAMSGPRTLEFKKTLDFNHTNTDNQRSHFIGSCWHWNLDSYMTLGDLNTNKVLQEHPAHNSSSSLFISVLTTKWPYNALEGGGIMATHHILDTLYRNELLPIRRTRATRVSYLSFDTTILIFRTSSVTLRLRK
jgi:hypothetical protein